MTTILTDEIIEAEQGPSKFSFVFHYDPDA